MYSSTSLISQLIGLSSEAGMYILAGVIAGGIVALIAVNIFQKKNRQSKLKEYELEAKQIISESTH
tara:strand:+ start:650 stop:847 length:198 start_codon:yes stop_codon:yes gene_type:complete